mgnify:CR=1 FL=1
MAEKKEADGMHPASDYAYTPDNEKVSTWKLRIDDSRHVAAAVAALGKGLMGNKVEIPEEDLPAVKRKVATAYRKFFPDNELPEILKSNRSFSDFLSESIQTVLIKYFGPSEQEIPTEVIKASEEMVSYEVVYEPFIKDAHGQWMSDTTLQKACENFNENLKKGVVQPNLFHLENTKAFTIEDSWIQKELDVVVEATGEKIKAGTWICKLKYHDNDLWTLKKAGVVGGVSIGARGSVNHETGEITNVTFDGDSNDSGN